MSPPRARLAGWGGLRADLAADVRRVADRLRTLPAAQLAGRLAAPPAGWSPDTTRADAGRIAADRLAVAAEAMEAAAADRPPVDRPLPRLGDFAVGDQVAVTGHDLLAALAVVAPDAQVWRGSHDPASAGQAVADAAAVLATVRRAL